jgi:serine/threonine protein kinase
MSAENRAPPASAVADEHRQPDVKLRFKKSTSDNNPEEFYDEIELLGVGVFGTAYKVTSPRNSGLKVLKTFFIPDKDKSWAAEAKALETLNSNHVIKYVDCFSQNPFVCVVTEYYPVIFVSSYYQ